MAVPLFLTNHNIICKVSTLYSSSRHIKPWTFTKSFHRSYRNFNQTLLKSGNYQHLTLSRSTIQFLRTNQLRTFQSSRKQVSAFSCRNLSSNYSNMAAKNEPVDNDATDIFQSAVKSVLPRQMIDTALTFDPSKNDLEVKGRHYAVDQNVFVVGFGKAVLGMARAVEDILSDHLVKGVISIPVGMQQCFREAGKSDLLLSDTTKLSVHEGAANNLPDAAALEAARTIHRLVAGLNESHLLIVLISGGGSALLPSPQPPITLGEEMDFTRSLAAAGATINELNTVRKNIELLKGGGLAEAASPSQVVCLILSDVIDDPLDIISSGPTVPDPSTPDQCLSLIKKFNLIDKAPGSVINFLKARSGTMDSKPHDNSHVQNIIVGSNKYALTAASEGAARLGYFPLILTNSQQGVASDVGQMFATIAKFVCLLTSNKTDTNRSKLTSVTELDLIKMGLDKTKVNSIAKSVQQAEALGQGVAIISGGETTVNVRGTGRGGRNQEMALACAVTMDQELHKAKLGAKFQIEFLSAGTDGIDGPTDAAGALVQPAFCQHAKTLGFDPVKYLNNNDSFSLFDSIDEGKSLIRTGHTGTNVMDLQILLVKAKSE